MEEVVSGGGGAEAALEDGAAADARRRRGRPPTVKVPSRAYAAVVRHREKQKCMMDTLEAELVNKMAQASLLAAENEALRARERVLHGYLATSASAVEGLEEELVEADERARAAEAAVTHALSQTSGGGTSSGAPGTSGDGGGAASGETASGGVVVSSSAGGAPVRGVSPEAASVAEAGPVGLSLAVAGAPESLESNMAEFFERYKAFVAFNREHRLRADGTLQKLRTEEPMAKEAAELIDIGIMRISSAASYASLAINHETGETEDPPPDMLSRIAKKLKLTERQQRRVLAAWSTFDRALQGISAERRVLCAALASMQDHLESVPASSGGSAFPSGGDSGVTTTEHATATPHRHGGWAVLQGDLDRAHATEGGISQVLQTDDHNELASALQHNMLREDQEWGILSRSTALLLEEHQISQVYTLAWPYVVSLGQVVGAYVSEVLGSRQQQRRTSQ